MRITGEESFSIIPVASTGIIDFASPNII